MLRGLAKRAKGWAAGEALARRNPLFYPRFRGVFAKLERAPAARRAEWLKLRLAQALKDAGRTAYGRRVGAPDALAGWPLLEPAAVRDRPGDFLRSGVLSVPSATGGTSGIPLPLRRSLRSVAAEQAALDAILAPLGVDLSRARVAVLRGDDIKPLAEREPPFWQFTLSGRRLVFSSNHLSRATAPLYFRALREFAADVWWVYPTALESLVRFAEESGAGARVNVILSSSEVLSPGCRDAAQRAFGARVLDHYGQAERVALAWALDDQGFRFLPGYSAVELLPVAGDVTRYEVVGTSLWNEAMPLVRYRTGDQVSFARTPSPAELEEVICGARPFDAVIGRSGDILIAPDGARLTGIDHFHRGVASLVRIQVVQPSLERVEILVIPAPGFGEHERAALLANARRKLPPAMSVEVRVVEELRRTTLGKTPFVIREGDAAARR